MCRHGAPFCISACAQQTHLHAFPFTFACRDTSKRSGYRVYCKPCERQIMVKGKGVCRRRCMWVPHVTSHSNRMARRQLHFPAYTGTRYPTRPHYKTGDQYDCGCRTLNPEPYCPHRRTTRRKSRPRSSSNSSSNKLQIRTVAASSARPLSPWRSLCVTPGAPGAIVLSPTGDSLCPATPPPQTTSTCSLLKAKAAGAMSSNK